MSFIARVGSSPTPGTMGKKIFKKINQDFFKRWSPNMAYVLGYFVADGCIVVRKERAKSPYIFNITSADLRHLYKLRTALSSGHKISKKQGGKLNFGGYQLQVSNQVLCKDLLNLGIHPRKTYNLGIINVPDEYFPDYVRGFFDGDGSVFIYKVNETPQIKSSFVAVSVPFIKNFNDRLCKFLGISEKSIHTENKIRGTMPQYNICFYVDDSEKLEKFMYGNNPNLFLDRKKRIFDQWKLMKRRHYVKQNYPSKIGWHLNKNLTV